MKNIPKLVSRPGTSFPYDKMCLKAQKAPILNWNEDGGLREEEFLRFLRTKRECH